MGFAVGANCAILRSEDGGATWADQEASVQINLYAVTAYGRFEALAVGERGTVLRTEDAGRTWEIQPNVTSNTLQAIAFLGGADLWVAGRGGSILRRSDTLSTIKTTESPKVRPVLKFGKKPKPRTPLVTITDDGDIPLATEPKKDN